MKVTSPNTYGTADLGLVKTLPTKNLAKLVWSMVRPYKKWMLIIFLAMLLETAMSLATPWPIKIIIDNVIGRRALPGWLAWMDAVFPGENRIQFAALPDTQCVSVAEPGRNPGPGPGLRLHGAYQRRRPVHLLSSQEPWLGKEPMIHTVRGAGYMLRPTE